MDLGTVAANVERSGRDAYQSPAELRVDVERIWRACHIYNGPASPLAKVRRHAQFSTYHTRT